MNSFPATDSFKEASKHGSESEDDHNIIDIISPVLVSSSNCNALPAMKRLMIDSCDPSSGYDNPAFQGDSESTPCVSSHPSDASLSSSDDSWEQCDAIPFGGTDTDNTEHNSCWEQPEDTQESEVENSIAWGDPGHGSSSHTVVSVSLLGVDRQDSDGSSTNAVHGDYRDTSVAVVGYSAGGEDILNVSGISRITDAGNMVHARKTRRAFTRQLRMMWAAKANQYTYRDSSRFDTPPAASTPAQEGSLLSYTRMDETVDSTTGVVIRHQDGAAFQTGSEALMVNRCVESCLCYRTMSERGGRFAYKESEAGVRDTTQYTYRTSVETCCTRALETPYKRRYKRASSAPPRPRTTKGATARWVGVHHSLHSAPPRRANSGELPSPDNSLASSPCTPGLHSPSTPVTPHIVVSQERDDDYEDGGGGGNGEDFGDAELNMDNSEDYSSRTSHKMSRSTEDLTGSKGEFCTKIQMTPDMGQNARHNSISSYLAPEIELSLQRKTRRNSMIGLIHRASSVNNLNLSPQQQQHLARVASAGNMRHGASKTSLSASNGDWRQEGNDSMIACLSALYGKILVVMGLAFPIGEFISGEMPLYVYKGFYLYLHLGSIAFLIYAYMFLLQVVPLPKVELKSRLQNFNKSRSGGTRSDVERAVGGEDARSVATLATFQNSKNYTITESTHESMYLKMGAMVFGIGSMIYSGLEVGQYFDLKSTAECADILLVISPVSRMLFTFIQMYFIFLNSRVAINKHRTIARFGLMHMIATNLCIWLNVLVEETKHEIHNLTHASSHGGEHHSQEAYDELYGHGLGTVIAQIADSALRNGTAMLASTMRGSVRGSHDNEHGFVPEVTGHHIVRRDSDYEAEHPSSIFDCRKSDMMSRLVDNASPFLFPCTIEYSLLCSGVLYVIWKNINKNDNNCGGERDSDISTFIARKARHHYSVDCAHATRGLFMGILVLVLTIISLILFFVLINNENTKSVAVLEANIIELSVYSVAILTVIIGMIQMRELEFVEDGDIELDNILLLIAQTGTYIYTTFTIIGGDFSLDSGRILPFCTAVITLIQTTLQTLFILNASRRCCFTYDQLTRKPGREMVTFLLICNLAMWAISTFETSRADAHPTQLNYYGVWAWTIISHVSMPLAIFYRFHVTVCLCEIWKRSYKLKNDFL